MTVEIGGRRRRLSKADAIVATLTNGAVEAEPRSQRLLLQLLIKLEGNGRLWPEDEEEDDCEDPREFLLRELNRIRERRRHEQAKALERLAEEEAAARAGRAVLVAPDAAPKDAA